MAISRLLVAKPGTTGISHSMLALVIFQGPVLRLAVSRVRLNLAHHSVGVFLFSLSTSAVFGSLSLSNEEGAMERIRRWAKIIGQTIVTILVLYVIVGALMIWLGYLPHGPVNFTEFGLALVALAVSAVVSVTNTLKAFLDRPVQIWHLIIAGFMIVLAVKHIIEQVIESAVDQIQKRTEFLDPDLS